MELQTVIHRQLSLSLTEARVFARRAVEKAEELGQAGTFVVVDASGVVITASRMDGTGCHSYPVSRAKAYLAATTQYPSKAMHDLCAADFPGIFTAFTSTMRDAIFPGEGAQPVTKDLMAVGAISTGMGVPPFVRFGNCEESKLIVEGKPANAEDLCISYALGKGYAPQHGDDLKKWIEAYGKAPEGRGTGLDQAPQAIKQHVLDAALRLCDCAIAEAAKLGEVIAVAVVDRGGDMIQIDRMDYAAPMTPDAAVAVAVTALNMQGPSSSAADYPDLEALARSTPFKYLPVAGGLPIIAERRVIGAIGVSGAKPEICEAIARAALSLQA